MIQNLRFLCVLQATYRLLIPKNNLRFFFSLVFNVFSNTWGLESHRGWSDRLLVHIHTLLTLQTGSQLLVCAVGNLLDQLQSFLNLKLKHDIEKTCQNLWNVSHQMWILTVQKRLQLRKLKRDLDSVAVLYLHINTVFLLKRLSLHYQTKSVKKATEGIIILVNYNPTPWINHWGRSALCIAEKSNFCPHYSCLKAFQSRLVKVILWTLNTLHH